MMRILKTVNLGIDCTGLTTVGYSLIDDNGMINQARSTTGVFEVIENGGVYASLMDFDSGWTGIIMWDTGEYEPIYASEDFNYQIDDSTSFLIPEIVEAIEEDGGKLDTIYDKLPNNGIADAQDSTTIVENTVRIESNTEIIDSKINDLATDSTAITSIVTDIDNKTDIINDTVNIIDSKINDLATDSTTIINTTTRIEDKVDIIDNKINNINLDTTNILDIITDIDSKVDIISDDLKRVLGLTHHNIFIDLPSYDNANNLIGARIRIYSDSDSVGSNDNVIGTYIIESDTDDEPGKFNNWKQIVY